MALTATIAITLSLYAKFTKKDFTILRGALWMVSSSLMMFGIFAVIFRFSVLYIFFVWCVIIMFGFYILIDTQLIMGNGRYKLSEDDYIIGALILYFDIIVLFLYALRALGRR